ncbi:hypothetical protein Btru_005737 [Bulinus truncatus]|nr:hypothetical protein Btru_005737 [Bulinus truncatus]
MRKYVTRFLSIHLVRGLVRELCKNNSKLRDISNTAVHRTVTCDGDAAKNDLVVAFFQLTTSHSLRLLVITERSLSPTVSLSFTSVQTSRTQVSALHVFKLPELKSQLALQVFKLPGLKSLLALQVFKLQGLKSQLALQVFKLPGLKVSVSLTTYIQVFKLPELKSQLALQVFKLDSLV